ncbi:acyltransferase family protein [Marichromatium bheemlicum]|uniref:Acyltransferase n=1 Tax=Marichromatium bheemlicum TaxID=365339 RepID=A0ABX1I726_9GAMM|nr:acyltransferase family protein [Marichromatium bheemlicum]NKN32749.1 acyltransferase [Marichromatium bheemlicum]
MQYRPEIDGLRAVAVIAVMLFHAGFPGFSGGFVGVDVFFVISGYLITGIILNDLANERFSLARFYERRARRILPALFVVLTVTLAYAWWWLPPDALAELGRGLVSTTTFWSNVLFWLDSGYFDTAAELKPLLHTWSLAVEEQYYLLFPLLMLVVYRAGTRLWLVLGVLLALSLGWAQWAAYRAPAAAFFLLPSRVWELAIGALTALLLHRVPDWPGRTRLAPLAGLLGLGLIVFAVHVYDATTPFPSLYALAPTLGTALIILAGRDSSLACRLLASRPLVTIGLVSYSTYLWHQPIFALFRHTAPTPPSLPVMAGLCVLAIALGGLSWRYVEQPFRSARHTPGRPALLLAVAVGSTLLSTGLVINHLQGVPARLQEIAFDYRQYDPNNEALQLESWEVLRTLSQDPDYDVADNAYDQQLWFDTTDPRRKVLIVGNSHAKDLFNIFHFSKRISANYQLARYGAQLHMLADTSDRFYHSANYQAADIVVLATRYDQDDVDTLPKVINNLQQNGKRVVVVKNIFEFRLFGTRTLIDTEMQRIAHDINLRLLSPEKVTTHINKRYYQEFVEHHIARTELPSLNKRITAIANATGAILLDRMDYICERDKSLCHAIDSDYRKFFYDYGHHTLAGSAFFAQRVDAIDWFRTP